MNLNFNNPEFLDQGACVNADPTLFFPPQGNKGNNRRAKELCNQCPIKAKCLDWILELEIQRGEKIPGIYGGLGTLERTHLHPCKNRKCTSNNGKRGLARNISSAYCSDSCSLICRDLYRSSKPIEYYMKGIVHHA